MEPTTLADKERQRLNDMLEAEAQQELESSLKENEPRYYMEQ